MVVKVSVVVPVYNPGPHIDPLIESLRRQSLPPEEFEAVFVDDGSTDGTQELLDRLAETTPNFRVIHIPNSGWPGRPRNLGIEAAVGEYVQFVDNDDELGVEALERLYDYARANGSDVVVGKEVRRPGHYSLWPVFAHNIPDARLGHDPILNLMTPHKMFRRQFLLDHGIRFFEGPRRLEDHPFVTRAYFLAERISVLADYPCYYWVRHKDKRNAGARPRDWPEWYGFMEDALDVVEEFTEPGHFRDKLLSHWFKTKALGLAVPALSKADDADAEYYFKALRDLTQRRFPPSVDTHVPASGRLRAALVRRDDLPSLRRLAKYEAGLQVSQRLESVTAEDGTLVLRGTVDLLGPDGEPVVLTAEGTGGSRSVHWRPPAVLAGLEEVLPVDVTHDLATAAADLVLHDRESGDAYLVPGAGGVQVPDTSGDFPARFVFESRVDPETAATGHPLAPALYDVHLLVRLAGWSVRTRLEAPDGSEPLEPLGGPSVTSRTALVLARPNGRVALDVDQQRTGIVAAAVDDFAGARLVPTDKGARLLIPLPRLSLQGGALTGKLRLTRTDGHLVRHPSRIVRPGGRKPVLRCALPLWSADDAVPAGRYTPTYVLRGARTDLPLVVEVDPGAAVLYDAAGRELSRVEAPVGKARRVLRKVKAVAGSKARRNTPSDGER